jgi:hypothetical protein
VGQRWKVVIAGEPIVLGTVEAEDETKALELGRELLANHRQRLGLEEHQLHPDWLRVTPSDDDDDDETDRERPLTPSG